MKQTHRLTSTLILVAVALGVRSADELVFRAITASDGLADNSAQTIKCTFSGRMTISTLGNINFYDGAQFNHIDVEEAHKYRLDNYFGHYHLYYDNLYRLWLKGSHYVSCVNLNTEQFYTRVDSIFASLGMEEKVLDMFVDINGDVWMLGSGYIYSNKYGRRFPVDPSLNLHDMEVYDHRLLMLFYENGLLVCHRLDDGSRLYSNTPYDQETAKNYSRSSVQLTHDGSIYQIRNGHKASLLLRYDVEKREWHTIMQQDYHLNNMVVHDGSLYIASEWGYFTYNINSGEIVHHKMLTMADGRSLTTDINTLEFDRQGGFWAGTEQRGLLYAYPSNSSVKPLTWDNPLSVKYWKMMEQLGATTEYNGMRTNTVFTDSRHYTWVGTQTGLYLFTSAGQPPRILKKEDGLLNEVIHSVIEDNNHDIWVGTSYGLSCVHFEGDSLKNVYSFNESDNVPDETFINGKAIKLSDGTIVMQALDHVVTFNPADFSRFIPGSPVKMIPKLTRLLVNGIEISAGDRIDGKVVLDKAITRTKVINLTYNQNSISLVFSALNFSRPIQTYYRVRIKELDGDAWKEYSYFQSGGTVDRQGLLHLPLLSLQPGVYHLEVLVSTVPGKWVGEPEVWEVRVNEPWWRTTGLLLLLGAIILLLVAANIVAYTRNTKMRASRNAQQSDYLRRIRTFANRANGWHKEGLAPTADDAYGVNLNKSSELDDDFVQLMMKVLPAVNQHDGATMTLARLKQLTGVNLIEHYDLVSDNLYKSPRRLIIAMRLEKAAALLRSGQATVEDIAAQCGFTSPSFFIACFFHQYRQTPKAYRADSNVNK